VAPTVEAAAPAMSMAGMGEPIRGGNRGGHDRFNWDDVKNDKFRWALARSLSLSVSLSLLLSLSLSCSLSVGLLPARGGLRERPRAHIPTLAHANLPVAHPTLLRENYLGHSLHGQIGRWTTTARGSDLTWWSEGRSQLNRSEAEEVQRKAEMKLVKEQEEDAMREAM
jgi:hypothetical protein